MGLAFSVPEGIKIPTSLVNIFKELQKDVGCSVPSHGNLERWAVQVNVIFCHSCGPFASIMPLSLLRYSMNYSSPVNFPSFKSDLS